MDRKLVLALALTILIGTLNVALNVQKAKASGTIYVRADGSIDPPDAPISTADNVTYTFVGNISDSIVVERDNIVVDGAGYKIQGTGSGNGITLSGRTNITIRNTTIKAFTHGIYLFSSNNNSVLGNSITANNDGYGIWLYSSSNNNSVSGNNITTSNNDGYGIILDSSSGNSVSGNNITANKNADGILLYSSSNFNSISGNSIAANDGTGVTLGEHSHNNTVCKNGIANSDYGIALSYFSDSNFICENNVVGNRRGILLYRVSSNRIFHNNFVANIEQVDSQQSVNAWDDGREGNYWSNHTEVDADSDGIDDAPYIIDGNNTDSHPLMGMFSDFNATSEHHVQTICNSSISGFQYDNTSISFNVTGEDGTSGFCRIYIPTALMNATYRVFVNGTEIPCTLLPCSNSTHSYLYFNYTHSTEEVIIIPEFPSFLVLPLFMIVTLLVAIAHGRKHTKNQRKQLDKSRAQGLNCPLTIFICGHIRMPKWVTLDEKESEHPPRQGNTGKGPRTGHKHLKGL